MWADARRLADDSDVEVCDPPAACPHPLDRERQEPVGGGAPPLRIGGRKVYANVAVRNRTEQRINKGVKNHIGVRMSRQTPLERNANAAQHHVVAIAELLHVETEAGANIAELGEFRRWPRAKSAVGGELHVRYVPLECRNRQSRPFGQRRVVGEVVAAGCRARRCASDSISNAKACGVCTVRNRLRSSVPVTWPVASTVFTVSTTARRNSGARLPRGRNCTLDQRR